MYALCWRQSALDKICSIDIMPRRLSAPERQSTQWDNMTRRQSAPEITCTETICPRDFMPPETMCPRGQHAVRQSVCLYYHYPFIPLNRVGFKVHYWHWTMLCYVRLRRVLWSLVGPPFLLDIWSIDQVRFQKTLLALLTTNWEAWECGKHINIIW